MLAVLVELEVIEAIVLGFPIRPFFFPSFSSHTSITVSYVEVLYPSILEGGAE